jgi:hypothetical protein
VVLDPEGRTPAAGDRAAALGLGSRVVQYSDEIRAIFGRIGLADPFWDPQADTFGGSA